MPTAREWIRICELEKVAIEHQSVEKWIEIDRKLDPNWTEEKSKVRIFTFFHPPRLGYRSVRP
jgi:hypothetical protein